MTSFKVVHSEAEDWVQAAKQCAEELCQTEDGYSLGFIYVTDSLADNLTSILTYLRKKNRYKALGWQCWNRYLCNCTKL